MLGILARKLIGINPTLILGVLISISAGLFLVLVGINFNSYHKIKQKYENCRQARQIEQQIQRMTPKQQLEALKKWSN